MPNPPPPAQSTDDDIDLDEVQPKHRDKVVSFRVPPEEFKAAKRRARKEGRSLVGILRSWFKMFAAGEAAPPPELPDETERAPKRKKKKPKATTTE